MALLGERRIQGGFEELRIEQVKQVTFFRCRYPKGISSQWGEKVSHEPP
jgi:hypothetical protein